MENVKIKMENDNVELRGNHVALRNVKCLNDSFAVILSEAKDLDSSGFALRTTLCVDFTF
ncbi:hypothetical protein KJ784_01225 [Patescibacteria group bacterium]|nr:hypothetical protein [Patescibacteria group bacterium]